PDSVVDAGRSSLYALEEKLRESARDLDYIKCVPADYAAQAAARRSTLRERTYALAFAHGLDPLKFDLLTNANGNEAGFTPFAIPKNPQGLELIDVILDDRLFFESLFKPVCQELYDFKILSFIQADDLKGDFMQGRKFFGYKASRAAM